MHCFTQLSIRTGWGSKARRYRRISYPFQAVSEADAAVHCALEEERVLLRLRQRTGLEPTPATLKFVEGLVFVTELT